MSFSYDFEPNALARWKRLDTDLQEQALDALEDALARPPQPDPSGVETRIRIHHEASPGVRRVLELRIGWRFGPQVAAILDVNLLPDSLTGMSCGAPITRKLDYADAPRLLQRRSPLRMKHHDRRLAIILAFIPYVALYVYSFVRLRRSCLGRVRPRNHSDRSQCFGCSFPRF